MTYFLRALLIAATTGILASCTLDNPTSSMTTSEHFHIVNGIDATPGAAISRSTGILQLPSGKYCSGVLLNDHVFLTAAHCLKTATLSPAMAVFVPDEDKSCFSAGVTEIAFAPKVVDGNKYSPDIALLKLNRAICTPAPVVLASTLFEGFVVTGAGFGSGSTPGLPDLLDMTVVSSDKKYLRSLFLDGYEGDAGVQDDWTVIENNYEEFSKMYLFAIAKNSEQSTCHGDSGGPVFQELDGVLHILGVVGGAFPHSQKGVTACQKSYLQFFAPIGPSLEWIKNTLKELELKKLGRLSYFSAGSTLRRFIV